MLNLRINEDLQARVMEYHDELDKAMYIKHTDVYNYLSTSMSDFMKLYQIRETIRNVGFINRKNMRQIENFVSRISLNLYMPGDIILKQGQRNFTFYYIHSGLVEVIQEKHDFEYFNHKEVEKFINQKDDQKQEDKEDQAQVNSKRESRTKVGFLANFAEKNQFYEINSMVS